MSADQPTAAAGCTCATQLPVSGELKPCAVHGWAVDPTATAAGMSPDVPSCNRPDCDCGDAQARRASAPRRAYARNRWHLVWVLIRDAFAHPNSDSEIVIGRPPERGDDA